MYSISPPANTVSTPGASAKPCEARAERLTRHDSSQRTAWEHHRLNMPKVRARTAAPAPAPAYNWKGVSTKLQRSHSKRKLLFSPRDSTRVPHTDSGSTLEICTNCETSVQLPFVHIPYHAKAEDSSEYYHSTRVTPTAPSLSTSRF